MQEMSLLFQKENEPEQGKNQQAARPPVCATSVVGGDHLLLWMLPQGGVSSWVVEARAGEGLWKPSQCFMERK